MPMSQKCQAFYIQSNGLGVWHATNTLGSKLASSIATWLWNHHKTNEKDGNPWAGKQKYRLFVCWSRSDFLNVLDVSCGFCSDMSEKFQSNQSELVILVLSGYVWVASSSAVDVVWNWTWFLDRCQQPQMLSTTVQNGTGTHICARV